MDVLGRMTKLSGGRVVFVGLSDERPDTVFVGFRNGNDEMKLMLSKEAWAELLALGNDPFRGMPLRDFPHKMVWRIVEYDETSTGSPRTPEASR